MTALAQRADLALSTVSGIERGYRNGSPETLAAMATVLGCDATELMADAAQAVA